MSDTINPSPWKPGEINGVKIARRVIFRSALRASTDWPNRMLDAIATAKALGVTMFEIDAPGMEGITSALEQAQEESRSRSPYMSIFPQVRVEGDEWKDPRVRAPELQYLTVYAVVVE